MTTPRNGTTTSTTFRPDYHYRMRQNATVCDGLQRSEIAVESYLNHLRPTGFWVFRWCIGLRLPEPKVTGSNPVARGRKASSGGARWAMVPTVGRPPLVRSHNPATGSASIACRQGKARIDRAAEGIKMWGFPGLEAPNRGCCFGGRARPARSPFNPGTCAGRWGVLSSHSSARHKCRG
jgi:hypothetical protein